MLPIKGLKSYGPVRYFAMTFAVGVPFVAITLHPAILK